MNSEHETCLARARAARTEADAAMLDNVRDRALRAEAAWMQMAQRAQRMHEGREKLKAEKAAAADVMTEEIRISSSASA